MREERLELPPDVQHPFVKTDHLLLAISSDLISHALRNPDALVRSREQSGAGARARERGALREAGGHEVAGLKRLTLQRDPKSKSPSLGVSQRHTLGLLALLAGSFDLK
mgnify:CR=1 FL=1